jgi:hypothetical protein
MVKNTVKERFNLKITRLQVFFKMTTSWAKESYKVKVITSGETFYKMQRIYKDR